MFSFNLPDDMAISRYAEAALAYLVETSEKGGERVRVLGDGSPEDLSISTLQTEDFKLVISGSNPYSYRVVLWTYVGSYDGSGGYGEWMAFIDGSWVSTEDTEHSAFSAGNCTWDF